MTRLLIILAAIVGFVANAQDYSIQDHIVCRETAESYCRYLASLSRGDVTRKVLIEDLWETTSNKMPNDLTIAQGRTELRKYLITLQNNQIVVDFEQDPIVSEYFFDNRGEVLFAFKVGKQLHETQLEEYIIVSAKTKKIKNIYREIPGSVELYPIEELATATSEEASSSEGELFGQDDLGAVPATSVVEEETTSGEEEDEGPLEVVAEITEMSPAELRDYVRQRREYMAKEPARENLKQVQSRLIDTPGSGVTTNTFSRGESAYLFLRSPIDGYLQVFIDDQSSGKVHSLVPYGTYFGGFIDGLPIRSDVEYVFFDPEHSSVASAGLTSDKVETLAMNREFVGKEDGKLYVIFGTSAIPDLLDSNISASMTTSEEGVSITSTKESTSSSYFQQWLAKVKSDDSVYRVFEFPINIY